MNQRIGLMQTVGGLFLCLVILTTARNVYAENDSLSLHSESAVLMDAESGRILYGKNADKVLPMASTTKIMTCIILLEHLDGAEEITVSRYAASMPEVKLGVRRGECYQVCDLLYSLMLESHNDSAIVLAEYLGKQFLTQELQEKPTEEFTNEESRQAVKCFCNLMNEKAKELGCDHTYFITPNGLDASETIVENKETKELEHSTTASELAKILRYCINGSEQLERYLQLTQCEQYSFSANGRTFTLRNHNSFLYMMQGAMSGKTGYTGKAGYCYVGALQRGEKTLIVALLACGWPSHKTWKWNDTTKLMEYGLDHYEYHSFTGEEIPVTEELFEPIRVINGQTDNLDEECLMGLHQCLTAEQQPEGILLSPDEEISVICDVPDRLTAPIAKNLAVGTISYIVDGVCYRKVSLCTDTFVERITPIWSMRQILGRYLI